MTGQAGTAGNKKSTSTTIGLKRSTKNRLNHHRAPGQCYDGFISDLISYWERYSIGGSLCGPGKSE